jgi:simple sugar transport system permease protein
VLFVGADVLILAVWNARRRRRNAGEELQPFVTDLRAAVAHLSPARLARPAAAVTRLAGRAVPGAATLPLLTVKAFAQAGAGAVADARRTVARGAAAARAAASPAALADPRGGAIAGIVVALFGTWLVLPPVEVRSLLPAIACAAIAAALGVRGVRAGHRRPGWGAVAAAGFAVAMGILAQRSSTAHLSEVFSWGALVGAMLVFATPLVYAAIGGMFSERSGVVNIGLEGMMLMGAFFGILGADKTHSWVLGLLIAMLAGGLMALVHAFFAIQLRANQIVGGTAMNFLAVGITGYFFVQIYKGQDIPPGIARIPDVNLHIDGVYFLGPAIGSLNLLIWASIALAFVAYIVMFRTPIGLRIRACGEHPRAADTLGIDVYRTRYAAVTVSGMLAAVGGAYLSIGYVGSFTENMTGGRGFIALAALIFGNWRPFRALAAAMLFGFSTALAYRLPAYSASLPGIEVIVQALPYVLTLVAVAGVIGRSIPPAAVGRPYKKQ